MSLNRELLDLGCTRRQTEESVGCIIFWQIPGGADYSNARNTQLFYSEELREKVEALGKKYDRPPEMAMTSNLPRSEHGL